MTDVKDDAVVERVRVARRRIVERCGADKHRMFRWAKRVELKHKGRVVGFEAAKKKS